jgi:hypothetical protein
MTQHPSDHLARLGAGGRPAGSAAAIDARSYCAAVLERAGFTTTEHAFSYSAFVGSWATPAAGVVCGLSAVGLFVGRLVPGATMLSLVFLFVSLAILAWVGKRGVLDLRLMRRDGMNLEAVRGTDPRVWLVAHIDSKWQPVSMITRVIGVIGTAIGLITLIALSAFPDRTSLTTAGIMLNFTWFSTAMLILSTVGNRNDGTLDNASGVAAVLEAVRQIDERRSIGVLITDAEELGLAGARAWVRGRTPGVALNVDSVDDVGRMTVMYSRSRPPLVEKVAAAAAAQSVDLRVLRLIPGILTDHVALADAGWETLTLSRGGFRTLQRIHTSRDTLDYMRGTGIAEVARVIARTVTELR